jgi:glutaredoxin 3
MKKVVVHSKTYCPFCVRAKNLLKALNVPFEEIVYEDGSDELMQLKERTGWPTVPIIYIGDELIGGFDDMNALHKQGKLMGLLKK